MKRTGLIFAAFALGACTHLSEPMAASQGAAQVTNFAAQVVDETPAKGAPAPDPVLIAAAVRRYRTDDVKTGKEEQPIIALNLGIIP